MSSRAWRVTATLVSVATLAGFVVFKFVLQPLTLRIEPAALRFGVGLLALALTTVAPVIVLHLLTRRFRPRPATFTVARSEDGPAFVAPESPEFHGMQAVLFMVLAGNAIPVERVPGTDRARLTTLTGVGPVLLTVAAVLAVLGLLLLWLARPEVTLTPAGVTLRHLARGRGIRWDELLPGGPHPPARGSVSLLVRAADGRPKRVPVRAGRCHIDGAFLATVIRHYVEHPEHRADIGTRQELDRLESAYTTWLAATPPSVSVG